MKLTRVIIDRAKWGKKALLNTKGKMCCLGFCAKSAGINPKIMRGASMPSDGRLGDAGVDMFMEKFPALLYRDEYYPTNTNIAHNLAEINDGMINGPKKEAKIKELGKEAGIQFVFTGSYR